MNNTAYEFIWYLNGEELIDETENFLVATQAGNYEVEAIDIGFSLRTNCANFSQAEIIESSGLFFEVNVLSQAFDGQHALEVNNVQGIGDYEFAVDNGMWYPLLEDETSLIISGLDAGNKIVRGRDINGCGEFTVGVLFIDYPQFFTPNEDGYNDTWNIVGLANQNNAKIYIFDRYGKLLKQLAPNGPGWDGTYNGKPMPGNDYWFRVEYEEPTTGAKKEFKSNFTLKR